MRSYAVAAAAAAAQASGRSHSAVAQRHFSTFRSSSHSSTASHSSSTSPLSQTRPSIATSNANLDPNGRKATRRTFTTSCAAHATAKDPYATLGVKRDSKPREIKTAYYDLAKKYHPDTNKDPKAKERFVEIQSAYDILSDEKKKAAFDQFGTTDGQPGFNPFGGDGNPFGGGGGFGGFAGFGGGGGGPGPGVGSDPFSAFEHIFGRFAGGGGGGRGAGYAGEVRGEDLEATVSISFEEACRGTTRTLNTMPIENCGTCTGSGMRKGAKKQTCGSCGGTGTRTFVIQSGFQMASTCPSCGGAGVVVNPNDACGDCEGVGKVRRKRTVEVKIPPGVDNGVKIRLDGLGDAPQGPSGSVNGPSGNLYVRVVVQPSKIWRRQGTNLYYEAKVPFYTAVLGGRVRVPTLDGDVDVRVPGGTQVGEEMLLRGRGVPSVSRRGEKGDLLVAFDVTIPRSLSKNQRELLQAFVDDVEGRAKPKPTPTPTPPPSDPTPPSSSSGAASGSSTASPSATSASSSSASPKNSDAAKPSSEAKPVPEAEGETKTASESKSKLDPQPEFTSTIYSDGTAGGGDAGGGGNNNNNNNNKQPSFEDQRQFGAIVGLVFLASIMILAGIGAATATRPHTNGEDGTPPRPLTMDEILDREVERRKAIRENRGGRVGPPGAGVGIGSGGPPQRGSWADESGGHGSSSGDDSGAWPPYPRALPLRDDGASSSDSSFWSNGQPPSNRSF
ncbi:hypothetical protein A4X09_0g4717 [Tilletia walkeri]|uniref:DnaJ homolog 1, mitochondrial n=1 Tax=Tilletia walkeri TaxID=117179 RepID=A0A8X7N6Q1_9BASI|nr:hypothetical protein A4X09_0g4717 [Tilletia walkeri]